MKRTLTAVLSDNADADTLAKAMLLMAGIETVTIDEAEVGLFGEPAKAKPSRPRNALFDALAVLDCPTLSELTPSAASRVAKALQGIRSVSQSVTAEQIKERADNYKLLMPGATLTSTALAAHWGRCAAPPIMVHAVPPPTPHWKLCKDIRSKLETHPANPRWVGYVRGTATPEQEQDYRQLQEKLAELEDRP